LADGVAAHRFAGAADEDAFLAGPAVEVLGEDREDVRREGDGPLAGLRLRVLVVGDLAFQQLGAAATDADRASGQVDVFAVQADDFASAEAAPRGDEDGGPIPRSDGIDQGCDLGWCGGGAFPWRGRRQRRGWCPGCGGRRLPGRRRS
jgi:hypothetical protein